MIARSRTWSAALLLLAALVSADLMQSRPAQASPDRDVDINFFYDALAPYGNWVDHNLYGRVWYPRGVPMGWRPYTHGHWEYAEDYGWVWVSDWSWGWAPFHYGHWAWDDWYGWIWVPGRVWAPAWVFWRYGGGYAAWAPIPPNAVWRHRDGLMTEYFDYDRDIPRDWWVSVPERHLHNRRIDRYLIKPHDNDRYLKRMDNFVNIDMQNDSIFNRGVPVKQIERSSGKAVRPVRLREVEHLEDRKRDSGRHELTVFRPNFRPANAEEVRREEQLAEQLGRQNAEQQRERASETGRRVAKPPANRGNGQVPPDNENLREWRRQQEGRSREMELQRQRKLEIQREQAERANEEAIRQQRQEREYRQHQMELQQQQQLELQRRQIEQTQRANEQAILQRQQEQQEQARQMELQRQQMEIQRQQMEQVERANHEAARQQQLLEQRQREVQQQMQIQREQDMRQQQMDIQRQRSEQLQRRQQESRPQEIRRGNNPRSFER